MIDTGPTEPAFPGQWVDSLPTTGEQVVREQWNGMSLRDYFAAKAMQNFCLSEDISYETAAEMAYRQADAMLRVRVRVK
jgi:hypothetical protein